MARLEPSLADKLAAMSAEERALTLACIEGAAGINAAINRSAASIDPREKADLLARGKAGLQALKTAVAEAGRSFLRIGDLDKVERLIARLELEYAAAEPYRAPPRLDVMLGKAERQRPLAARLLTATAGAPLPNTVQVLINPT